MMRQIPESRISGNVTEVFETETALQCASECIGSVVCDHVIISKGSGGKLNCQLMVTSDGQSKRNKTFSNYNQP